MNRIKICHVIDRSNLNPLLYNSIKFSDRERFSYTVVSLEPENGLQQQMRGIAVESFSMNCLSRKSYPATTAKLVRLFRQKKFDVVQVHSFDAGLVALVAAAIARVEIRIFSGHHSHEVPLHKNRKLLWTDSFLARRIATHVIAPSENMKAIFVAEHKVPPAKIRVIVHGIDLEDWRERSKCNSQLRKELGIEDKTLFGAVGRLFWVKGFETLIRAFAAVAENNHEVALVIAGEGVDEARLSELIRQLKMTERIKLIGNRSDIAAIMNEFEVLIHPAIAESFGLIYPEALTLGKPIIATRGGIAEEIIRNGENGFLVNAGSVPEMQNAINKMLNLKGEWERMGAYARATAERFSIVTTQADLDRYILSLVAPDD